MFSVVLSLGLLTVASSRQLLRSEDHSPQRIERFSDSTKLTVDIPPADQRNPAKCELYENVHMEEGCQQSCSVGGFFANRRIQESHRRKISQCRAAGSYCRFNLARSTEMNVTLADGRCTKDCRCVPLTTDGSQVLSGLEMVVGALAESIERRSKHRRVRHGMNHFGKLRIHVPSSEFRNQTGCEEYEQRYYPISQRQEEFQCKDVCSVRGNLGRAWFHGKPRVLATNGRENSYCSLKAQVQGKFELRGAEQMISGRCRQGVCRPRDWVEAPAETNTIHVSGKAMKEIRDYGTKDVVVQALQSP